MGKAKIYYQYDLGVADSGTVAFEADQVRQLIMQNPECIGRAAIDLVMACCGQLETSDQDRDVWMGAALTELAGILEQLKRN